MRSRCHVEQEQGRFLTARQVADQLSYSRNWILDLMRQGRIRAIKPTGTRWRIPASEVERLKSEVWPPQRQSPELEVSEIAVGSEHMARVLGRPRERTGDDGEPWPVSLYIP